MRSVLGFSLVLAAFIIGPPFLPASFDPYPLLRWGDVLDLATPVVVLPAAWLLFARSRAEPPVTGETLLFAALAALFAMGQGMHLAANAIGHLVPVDAGDAAVLTHDLDEVLSHLIWHGALIGLSGLIAWRSLRGRDRTDIVTSRGALIGTAVAILLYGFTYFAMVVEGGTGVIGIPGAVLVAAGGLVVGRLSLARRPAAALFTAGYLVALALCAVWAGLNGGELVEFSKAGLIE